MAVGRLRIRKDLKHTEKLELWAIQYQIRRNIEFLDYLQIKTVENYQKPYGEMSLRRRDRIIQLKRTLFENNAYLYSSLMNLIQGGVMK